MISLPLDALSEHAFRAEMSLKDQIANSIERGVKDVVYCKRKTYYSGELFLHLSLCRWYVAMLLRESHFVDQGGMSSMDMRPLIEWAKRFRGFLGIVAFFLVVLLSVIIYLFTQGSFDQVLSNFGKLTGSQFLILVCITLGLFFIVAVLLIFLSYKSTRPPQVGQGDDVIYVQVYDSVTKQRLGGAEVYWNLRGTRNETTNANGEARFIFPSIYKGETCKIEAVKEGYQSKFAQVELGKKPDVEFYLSPKRKGPPPSKLEEVTTEKDSDTSSKMGPQSQNKSIPTENTARTDGTMPNITLSVQIPDAEIETIQSKRHRLRKIKDSIRLLREEGSKNSNVTMPALKAKLEFEERNATSLDLEIREELRTVHSPLPRQSYTRFIGRKEKLAEILAVLEKRSTLPIVAIDGIGGAGKTALARELAQNSLEANTFYVAVWESDKPTEFTGGGILPQSPDEISFENLLDRIGRKLGYFDVSSLRTMREKKDLVRHILNAERYLVVIDNLETIKGYRDLVNNLDGMFGNSKAILTTRKKIAEFRDVYPVSLGGMELAESIEFLKSEATERGEAGRVILEANESLLERIYITTGGLPLAMRLVLGQTTRSSPNTVLKHLEAVNYQKIQDPESDEDVYNQFFKFIYWDSWNQLSDNGKQLLIELGAFDPTEGARRDFLSTMSELSSSDLDDAASELVEFSLVRPSFEDDQEIFYLHPLTHRFVQHDV